MGPGRQVSRYALTGLLGVAGSMHFVVPSAYDRIVPRVLGPPRPWVLVSGLAELGAAALLALPRTRRAGALAAATVFVLVFPANVQMALDGGVAGAPWPLSSPVAAWLRLPFQPVLVWWALSLWRPTARPCAPPISPGRSR
jgi:uncharacterized membrane protein